MILFIPPMAHHPTRNACVPRVYVDGQLRTDVMVASWQWLAAPPFGRASLVLGGDAFGRLRRVEALEQLPPIGSSIRVVGPAGDASGELVGSVVAHELRMSEDGEQLAAIVTHQLADLLGGTITSLFQVSGSAATPALVELPQTKIRFGYGPAGQCSAKPVMHCGRLTRGFSAAADARPWTVADALAYLLATAVPAAVHVPTLDELESLCQSLSMEELTITGMTVARAMEEVAKRAGLAIRAARDGVGLAIYRPGIDGRPTSVTLQPAGGTLSTAASNLWRGQVTFHRRPASPAVLVLGEPKRYEATFDLQPGWDPASRTTRWRDCVRSLSGDWPAYADVYRKWVLNEHGYYAAAPWNLPAYDFSAIAPADFPLQRPRQLLPCLSTNTANQSLGVVVEVSTVSGVWARWRGPLWISRDECSIYLGGDALPADFFQAALAGSARVRVTAVVQADVRLAVELSGDERRRIVLAARGQAAWRQVHNSSVFHGRHDLGEPACRDDSDVLRRQAQRHQQAPPPAVEASLELAWIDLTRAVGDVLHHIEGRGLDLAAMPMATPAVRAVTHDFLKQTTHLEVTG